MKTLPVSQKAKNSIVLIGGPMTMDDGSKLDSRQPVEGDPTSQIAQRSLATSWLWWDTTSSVVLPILDTVGRDASALIFGQRSVVEVDSRGELKRTRLRSILRGGVGTVSVVRTGLEGGELPDGYEQVAELTAWNGESLGVIGVRSGEVGRKWRFVDGYPYLEHTAGRIGARVIVNTDPWMRGPVDQDMLGSAPFEALERDSLSLDSSVLVLPHTHAVEGWLGSYVDWVEAGRPISQPTSHDVPEWDPDAPPDPLLYTHPVPATASFKATGLIQEGRWRKAADLEAARLLLHSRYDLRIGIWDLASNRVLRDTLLDEISEPSAPPTEPTEVPRGAAGRADAVVQEKLDQRALIRGIVELLEPLRTGGWQGGDYPLNQMRLALTEPLALWPGDEARPLLSLYLAIDKRQTTVSIWTSIYNHMDLTGSVKDLEPELKSIAGQAFIDLDTGWPTIWKVAGGWGDDVDWVARARELASRTADWVELFQDLADECRRIRIDRLRSWQNVE